MSLGTSIRTPGTGENVSVISKTEGGAAVKLQKMAADTDALAIPSVAIFSAVSAADTEMPDSGTAQAGGVSTITLAATASAVNSYYSANICRIYITGGTGAGQNRKITAYNGATKVATVDSNWTTAPDATSTYAIYMDCEGMSHIYLKPNFSAPSQNGAFMKAALRIKLFDDARNELVAIKVEPMSLLKHTYATTGSYLTATAGILDGTRHHAETIILPIVRGAKNFRIMLDGQPAQMNTWSAGTTPNTIVYPSGDITVFASAV